MPRLTRRSGDGRQEFYPCSRCGRRPRSVKQLKREGWISVFLRGRVVGAICGVCQTPEENAEALTNELGRPATRRDHS